MPTRPRITRIAAAIFGVPILASAALLLFAAPRLACAQSADTRSGIVYGTGYAFLLDAPDGWVLDDRAGVEQGLRAVFYPRGSSWAHAPAVIYTRAVERDTTGEDSLEAFVRSGVTAAQQRMPRLKVERLSPLTTRDGRVAEVRVFDGQQSGDRDMIAYIADRRAYVLIVLTARSEGALAGSRAAFASLVQSYESFTDRIVAR